MIDRLCSRHRADTDVNESINQSINQPTYYVPILLYFVREFALPRLIDLIVSL